MKRIDPGTGVIGQLEAAGWVLRTCRPFGQFPIMFVQHTKLVFEYRKLRPPPAVVYLQR
jgi:hypothetical protein